MFIVHHLGLTAETTSLIPVISNRDKWGEGSDKLEEGKTHHGPQFMSYEN